MKTEKFFTALKIIGIVFASILAISILIIPYFAIFYYLKKQNKKIILYPEFEIISIENKNKENLSQTPAEDIIRLASEGLKILERIKNDKK